MPAPKLLAGLSKPLLFGLYGAVGGLLGALVFAEPLWQLASPPPPPPAKPQVAVTASKDVEVFIGGENEFTVEIARDGFDGPIAVRFENLPAGVAVASVTIPKGETEAKAKVAAARGAAVASNSLKVVAEAKADGKTLTAETSIACHVSDPSRSQADIVFVLDVTGSMGWAIDGVRRGIGRFADELNQNRIDFRVGLVAFRDLTYPEDEQNGLKLLETLQFKGSPFTSDPDTFRAATARLRAAGGGDDPESSLEAIGEACNQQFRKSATKVLLLITDALPKVIQGQTNGPQPRAAIVAGVKGTAEVV